MKKVQKGFTLVELIVVITILAILATIAFISLQGYSQDARNSKVASDLRTIASSIETSNTQGNTTVSSILDDTKNTNVDSLASTGATFGSGIVLHANNHNVGGVNFVALKQNGADFKDTSSTPRDYVYAYASTGSRAYYQLAGEVTLTSGANEVYVKGNYIEEITADADGLVIGGTAGTGGLTNGASDTIGLVSADY